MSLIEAFILGLIQGLTEFIPVSSSGHLLLAHEVFGSDSNTLAFDLALHVGTLLALFIYFRKDILTLLLNVFKNNRDGRLARLLLVATIPAALMGLLFSGLIEDNARSSGVVAVALVIGAVLMLFAEQYSGKDGKKEINRAQGATIGIAQAFALIPGVSRSGITMTAGMFLGLGRVQAARFSFLLAIPIIGGSALGFLFQDSPVGTVEVGDTQLIIAVSAAFASGLLAIKFLLGAIAKIGLRPFAYYRIALAIVVLLTLV